MTENTSLIHLNPWKRYSPGYVYMVRFAYFKNCYKIGSSSNLYSRFQTLRQMYGPMEVIAYGYTVDRADAEFFIQTLLQNFSHSHFTYELLKTRLDKNENRYSICKGIEVLDTVGPEVQSTEFFLLCNLMVSNVIHLMDILCSGVQVGINDWRYNIPYERKGWAEV